MSKLYDKYLYLKKLDSSKIYLIKSGIFYVALEDDALELSEKFNFKLTNLNDKVIKCGFPKDRIQYYTNLLDIMNVKYEIVDLISSTNDFDFIEKIAKLDLNNISYKDAHDILQSLNKDAKSILLQNSK